MASLRGRRGREPGFCNINGAYGHGASPTSPTLPLTLPRPFKSPTSPGVECQNEVLRRGADVRQQQVGCTSSEKNERFVPGGRSRRGRASTRNAPEAAGMSELSRPIVVHHVEIFQYGRG